METEPDIPLVLAAIEHALIAHRLRLAAGDKPRPELDKAADEHRGCAAVLLDQV